MSTPDDTNPNPQQGAAPAVPPQPPHGVPVPPPQAAPAAQPPYGAPAQSPYGAPAQPPYGAPAQPPYGAPAQGVPAQPPYGAPAAYPYPTAQPHGGPAAAPQYGAPGAPQYGAPQYGAPGTYGYPAAKPSTGTLSWALGFLIFIGIPFLSGIVSGVVMASVYRSVARRGEIARQNARSAANWALTYLTVSIALLVLHIIMLAAFGGSSGSSGFFPIGIPITLYFAVSILHVVLIIMGTVKASGGKVLRVPFAIPLHPVVNFDVELPNVTVAVSAEWVKVSGRGTVVVAHGAGAGMEHPFLTGFTDALNAIGFSTLRFNFPYREQGRRMPGPAAHAITTWRAAVVRTRALSPGAPVWAAGKSYGGRMASMAVAEGMSVDGLIYLGYPLHPPGRPEKPRAEHLPAIAVPQLFVEGSNDPFIQPLPQFEQVVATCADARVAWIDGGGHSFEVKGNKRAPEVVGASLAPLVADFTG